MTHKPFSRHSLESCTLKLNRWKPFFLSAESQKSDSPSRDPTSSSSITTNKQKPKAPDGLVNLPTKKQCLSDRPMNPQTSISKNMEFVEFASPTTLIDTNDSNQQSKKMVVGFRHPWKRRRRGSRSASGRSSGDRSRTAVAAASASDFPIWAGTDSSGELFFNCDQNWVSDDSKGSGRKEGKDVVGGGENVCSSSYQLQGVVDSQNNESGYVSEPGYRGDVEYGYGDELDEEEDDSRILFWGDSGAADMEVEERMEDVGANAFSEQKSHHRCRRKKHEYRMVVS
ncbi:uncharacterized protein LOC116261670 [Nymphaea colorata]|nr:uncharacterized protein LOC116261670 [Nymphaea colorata]